MKPEIPELMPGDILLYRGWSLFDIIIMLHTGSYASHVECYWGQGMSLASRNGKGVSKYPFRLMGLYAVLRPKMRLDFDRGNAWFFSKANNKPYGFADLGRFVLLKIPGRGMICSQFVALLFDNLGASLFAGHWERGAISPRDFMVTDHLDLVYRNV